MTAQVYGGSLSLVIGAHLWSQSQQASSTCYAGATVVSGLWTELNNIRITGSQAGTYTIGEGASVTHNHTFRMSAWARHCLCSLDSNAGSSSGSNVRLAQRLSRAPFQLLM